MSSPLLEISAAIQLDRVDLLKKHVPSPEFPFDIKLPAVDAATPAALKENPSLLSYAVFYGTQQVFDYLIENGASINLKDDRGRIPIHFAFNKFKKEIISVLIDHGCDINKQDLDGRTLLHSLVAEGKDEAVAQFLAFDSVKLLPDHAGITPFHIAIQGKSVNIVMMLIEKYGRSLIEMKFPGDMDILQYMLKTKYLASFQYIFSMLFPGENPLFYVTTHGSIELLSFFINPMDLNLKNHQGKSLVKIAMENGHLDLAIYLLSLGAECDFSDVAFLSSRVPLRRIMFLKNKYDWTKAFEGRESFSMFALRKPFNPALFKFAVKCGINPDERDPLTGASPLYKIIQDNNTAALKILLENGFPPFYEGKQPLISLFARAKNPAMLMTLLSNGVSQNDVIGDKTPLMSAASSRDSALQTYEQSEEIAFRDLIYLFDVPTFERNFGAALVLYTQKPEITPKHVLQAATSFDLPALFFYLICSKFGPGQISEVHVKSPVKNQLCHQMIEFMLTDDSPKTQSQKFNSLTFGNTGLLHIAAKYASKEIFERLVRKGFDIDAEDSQGFRPLDYALESCRFDNVSVLVRACVCCTPQNPECPTILHTLASNIRIKFFLENATDEDRNYVMQFIEYALGEGQSLTEVDFNGLTPILIAALDGNLTLCEIFMRLGAGNDFVDNDLSYLHILLSTYQKSMEDPFATQMFLFRYTTTEPRLPVKRICSIATEVFSQAPKYSSHDGDTILHICTKLNLPVLVEMILRKGETLAKKDEKNNNGDSALHIAARLGNMQLAQVLVENGCEINIMNNMQQTPLMVALSSPNPMCAMYLISMGAAYNVYDINMRTPLHLACMNGHFFVALALLNESTTLPVNFADIYGRTPIYYAAKTSQKVFLMRLLTAKANLFITDYKGRTPLHAACKAGNVENVEYLIDSLPPYFSDDDRNAPIHLAAMNNHPQVLQLFAKKEGSWNLRNARGDTPLHVAVRRDNVSCVQVLLALGANMYIRNFDGETPLVLAAALGKHQCLNFFLSQQIANFIPEDGFLSLRHALLGGDFEYANELLKSGISVQMPFWGRSLLTMAVVKNRLDIVKFLCAHKAMGPLDTMDLTPFAYAYTFDYREILDEMLKQYPGKRQADILEMFAPDMTKRRDIARHSSPQEQANIKAEILGAWKTKVPQDMRDKGLSMPQIMVNAIKRNDMETMRKLLADYAMNPNTTYEGQTLLSYAVAEPTPEMAQLLIAAGADPNRRNKSDNIYPLLYVFRNNKQPFIRLLLDNGARLDLLDNDEKTLLHLAAEESVNHFASSIIEKGANVNALDKDGRTPLHIAVEKGKAQFIELLMGAGARKDMKDNDGRSPAEIAQQQKDNVIISVLNEVS